MVQLATFKGKRKTERVTAIKPKPQHFAIFELNITECRSVEFCQTEIATVECALRKFKRRKIVLGKIATVENAIVVLTALQRGIPVKPLVLYVCLLHPAVPLRFYFIPPKAPKHMFLCSISTSLKPTRFMRSSW